MLSKEIAPFYPHGWKSIDFSLPNTTIPKEGISFDIRIILYAAHQNYFWNVKLFFEPDNSLFTDW